MKILKIAVLVAVISVLSWGVYNLISEKQQLQKEVEKLRTTVSGLAEENKKLATNIEYLKIPQNLLKEIKSRFNYKEKGEELIIIVTPETPETPND